jgi:hypothetical protein
LGLRRFPEHNLSPGAFSPGVFLYALAQEILATILSILTAPLDRFAEKALLASA